MFYLSSLSIAEKSVMLEFEVGNFSSLDRRTDDVLRKISEKYPVQCQETMMV